MSVFVNIISDFDDKGLRNATGQLNNFARNATKIAAGVTASLAAIGTGIAIRGISQFARAAVSEATDLGEAVNAVNVAFGNASTEIQRVGETAATQMGLAKTEFLGAAVQFSAFAEDIATGAGRDVPSVIEEITQRGADFASVYNIDVAQALQAFQSGLSGEIEPLKRFGIVLSAETVKNFAYANSIAEQGTELTEQQKVLARYGLLMEETSKVQGDFVNTSDSLANRQRILAATFADVQAEVGVALLPAMEEFAAIAQDDLLPVIADLAEEFGPVLAEVLSDVAEILKDALDPSTQLGAAVRDTGEAFGQLFSTLAGGEGTLADSKDELAGILGVIRDLINFTESMIAGFIGAKFAIEEAASGDFTPLMQFLEMDTVQFVNEIVRAEQGLLNLETQANNTANAINGIPILSSADIPASSTGMNLPENPRPGQIYTWFNYSGPNGQAVWYQQRWTGTEWTEPEKMTYEPAGARSTGGSVQKTAADFIREFFSGIDEEVEKQRARMELADFGLSEALIDNILSTGEWSTVFEFIKEGGQELADSLQRDFNRTAKGIAEIERAARDLQDNVAEGNRMFNEAFDKMRAEQQILEELKQEIADIKERFAEFREEVKRVTESISPLETFERTIGRFEQRTRDDLERIEDNLRRAFENDYILEEAYRNLTEYARKELGELLKIQRQRDELLAERNAAQATIFGIAEAVTDTGRLIGLLDDVESKTREIEVTEVIEGIVQSADKLNGFRTTLTRNFTEVVEETVDKSSRLTSNFQAVIERTRQFIDNLETLREMGLDPFLFNQLVEAGAEAGGATAQALVEGGSDTVNEVNKLQGELEAMGIELGEITYDTMKDQGEQFVSGIVDGLDDELVRLEFQAVSMADAFANAFEAAYNAAIANMELQTIEIAEAEAAQRISDLDPQVDEAAAAYLEGLISRGEEYVENQIARGGMDFARGGATKVGIYEGALEKVLAGEKIDVSGIQSGLSSEDLAVAVAEAFDVPQLAAGGIVTKPTLSLIGEAGPEAVVPLSKMGRAGAVYNVYVTASNRLGGAQAGEEVVNALKTYNTTNGDFNRALTGFGA